MEFIEAVSVGGTQTSILDWVSKLQNGLHRGSLATNVAPPHRKQTQYLFEN
jgi:hypothetical protein